jgi:hypothetical protein
MAAYSKGLIALLMVSVACSSFAASVHSATIRDDRGGMIRNYLNRWADYKASPKMLRLDGPCISACTMFTSLPNVCITERVVLGFHKGSNARATRTMRMMWHEKIRVLVDADGELAPYTDEAYTLLWYEDLKGILQTCPAVPVT